MVKNSKYITDYGGDGETIILLHGFLSSSRYWKKLQPLLSADGFRVITIDLLGFGRAPKPRSSSYSYSEHLLHIQSSIDSLNLGKPSILIGHSMGGLLAMRYAINYPQSLKSLILLHPPLYKDSAEVAQTLRSTNTFYQYFLYSPFRRIGWIFARPFTIFHLGRHSRFSRDRSLKNIIEATEILQDLQMVRVKTLLLVGLKDRPEYVSNLKDVKVSTYVEMAHENVDHHSPIRKTELVKERIARFL